MKTDVTKKWLSVVLCFCLIFLAGCGGSEQENSEKDVKGKTTASDSDNISSLTLSSEDFNTSSSETTTTTITTTTTTAPSTRPSSQASTQSPETGNGEKLIALTFDDGPHTSVTDDILDTLEKYDAKATFFVVGNRAGYDKDALKRAVDMGCEIGSHTHSHKNLTKLTVAEMDEEMKKSSDAISAVTGKTVTLMRPPEGAHNATVRSNLDYPLIMWSVDSKDWKYRDAQKNFDEINNYVFDGAIILMHDLYPATAETVEKLIPELMARGYKFVTVTELMQARGITMENGKTYSSARP